MGDYIGVSAVSFKSTGESILISIKNQSAVTFIVSKKSTELPPRTTYAQSA